MSTELSTLGSVIKTAYEGEADTNAFTDAEKTKLAQAVLADGTQALTASWDVGSFQIRAETFQSDVATGTAPFTVASTTVVANLNADLLDGNEASALLDRANHTGTQAASTISDFDTEVANNSAVTANTAKVTNANHTGDAAGDGALTLQPAAITGKGAVTVAGSDLLLVADVSASPQVLGQVTAQAVADLFDASGYLPLSGGELTGDITFAAASPEHTVDGRNISADGAKLDGIEAGADVTDTANVTAAGALMDSEFSAAGVMVASDGAGTYTTIKIKHDGTAAPTVDNDTTEGYAVGSRWIDATNDKEYVCLDAATGAAVWTETTGAGSGLSEAEVDARVVAVAGNSLNTQTFSTGSVADDGVYVHDFGADMFAGNFIISANLGGGTNQGIFAIRAAASSAYCVSIASDGITATTGALTGTTGVNGALTVATHTDRKLYIENRLGGARVFTVTLGSIV